MSSGYQYNLNMNSKDGSDSSSGCDNNNKNEWCEKKKGNKYQPHTLRQINNAFASFLTIPTFIPCSKTRISLAIWTTAITSTTDSLGKQGHLAYIKIDK